MGRAAAAPPGHNVVLLEESGEVAMNDNRGDPEKVIARPIDATAISGGITEASRISASVDTKNPCYSGTDYSGTTQSPPLKPQL